MRQLKIIPDDLRSEYNSFVNVNPSYLVNKPESNTMRYHYEKGLIHYTSQFIKNSVPDSLYWKSYLFHGLIIQRRVVKNKFLIAH